VEVPTTGLGGTRETTFRLGRSWCRGPEPNWNPFFIKSAQWAVLLRVRVLKPPVQAPRSRDALFRHARTVSSRKPRTKLTELRSPDGAARGFQGSQALCSVSVGPHPVPSPPQARSHHHQGDIQLQISVPGRSIQAPYCVATCKVRQLIARVTARADCVRGQHG
jgi:hypothetical protein